MADLADIVGVLVIVSINTAIAAVLTRFFRLQLVTQWGSALYVLVVVPPVHVIVLLLASGVLGLGATMGRATAIVLTVVVPLGLGAAIDVFLMPPPEEVDYDGSDGPS